MFGNPFDLRDELKPKENKTPDPFGRLGFDDEPDTEIADIRTPTELKAPVGDNGQNSRRDVAKTEQLLGQAMRVVPKTPQNKTVILANAGTQSKVTTSWAPDQVRDDMDAGRSGLSDEAFSENQRAARYLASRNGVGEFSKFVIDGIESDGGKAIAETVDLYRQTAEMNQAQADALIKKVASGLSPENAERLQLEVRTAERDGSETLSIGVWPDGEGPSKKPENDGQPTGEGFDDTATDDETPNEDNLRFSRDWRDEALQHLIEGGLDADSAKQFLEMLPEHVVGDQNSFVDALTWLSGQLKTDKPLVDIPYLVVGGNR